MKRFTQALGTSVALVLLAVPVAYAGSKAQFFVTINTTARTAYGAMGTARNSTDAIQNIYCRTFADATSGESVRCFANNSASVYVSCYSSSPALVRSVQSANDSAYIYFAWDASGVCQAIDVLKGSHLEPKAP
ncbi:hypothetical protein [Corallococcus carmarthensis]|uniref:Uncharacterized protein n=1 Tax=Corallococcus carmarthensis TaxID=2316728 RepID=A0A3A8KF22_9BACT|nr:hypothetical protein [Corallococcus carmarthensis]NOK17292.1 hypothetical protein [Corallococcus carmarthensis]RKH06778.1 hypothetical protein D7X32_03940 [Corallococcus carmarthensis]